MPNNQLEQMTMFSVREKPWPVCDFEEIAKELKESYQRITIHLSEIGDLQSEINNIESSLEDERDRYSDLANKLAKIAEKLNINIEDIDDE